MRGGAEAGDLVVLLSARPLGGLDGKGTDTPTSGGPPAPGAETRDIYTCGARTARA